MNLSAALVDIVSFLLTGTSLQEIRRHSEGRLHLRSAAFPFPECKRRDGDGDEGGSVRSGDLGEVVVVLWFLCHIFL